MLKYKSFRLVLIAVVSLVMAWAGAADVYAVNQIAGPAATVEVNEGEVVTFNIYASDDETDEGDRDFFLEVDDADGIVRSDGSFGLCRLSR